MDTEKRKIGIIGGLGPLATCDIYRRVIKRSQTEYGAKANEDYPHLLIESIPIRDFIEDKSSVESARMQLRKAARDMESSGVRKAVIACNTAHLLLEDVGSAAGLEFFSIIDEVAKYCEDAGLTRVGLLGSPVLIESGIYRKSLASRNVGVLPPNSIQIETAKKLISRIMSGKRLGHLRNALEETIDDFIADSADKVVLACTELPLAMISSDYENKIINPNQLLANKLCDYYYNGNPN